MERISVADKHGTRRSRAGYHVRESMKSRAAISPHAAAPPTFQAFVDNYQVHSRRIFECAYRILQNRADAEDTVQEVFIKVQKHADQFSRKSLLSTWLYRVTFNAALECLRRRRRHKECRDEVLARQLTREGPYTEAAVDWLRVSSVEEVVYREELRCTIKQTLDLLRPIDRQVVYLSEAEDLTDREIARLLGLTVSAVKTRLYRSRVMLRARLAGKLGYVPW